MAADRNSLLEARAIVDEHDVRFEIRPELAIIDGLKTSIGYEIEISGAADCDGPDDVPGCDRCDRTFSRLCRVAELAGARPDDIPAYDSSWHTTPRDSAGRRIVLTIRLTRYDGEEESDNESESERLVSIERRLTDLGVRRGRS
ncbi:MAG: hypothetical protein JXO72_11225 [Vicinamibacteria bacterium]|nr:hypothetical protein [Vicinamibacteria bacterium]